MKIDNYELSKEQLENTLKSFLGSHLQEVPSYSAVKVNGKRLYEYARNSISVELPKKIVNIKEINLLEYKKNSFTFKVKVSKGTYIRSLIRDIGNKVGIPMVMNELRRTKIDKYEVNNATSLDYLNESDIIDVKDFLDIPKIIVDSILEKKILNGVRIKNIYNSEMIMFFNQKNELLAIYKKNDKNELCMYKFFY